MTRHRIVPDVIRFVRRDFGATARLPVASIKAGPPATPSLAPVAVTIAPTDPAFRPKVQGVSAAWIGSDLRMHVLLFPGTERDGLLACWPASDDTIPAHASA